MKSAKNRRRPRPAKKDAAQQTAVSTSAPVTNGWRFVRGAAPALIAVIGTATLIGVPGAFQRSDSSITSVPASTTATQATSLTASSLHTTTAGTEPARKATVARRTTDALPASTGSGDAPRPPAVEPTRHLDAVPNADAVPRATLRLPANSVLNAKLTTAANSKSLEGVTPRETPLTHAEVTNAEVVTITGCLQAGDDSFWLKDASGADAPTSRSWKSGFLKKHAPPIQVVAAARTVHLSNYIAQRVTATGTLAQRTMQARSLERITGSCH